MTPGIYRFGGLGKNTVFGIDGLMGRDQAYRLINEAGEGSFFYRFALSPDPKLEDTKRDLHLREVTEKTMQTLMTRLKQEVAWVAAEHDDHAPNPTSATRPRFSQKQDVLRF